jgi:hypothetical protein
MLGLRFGLLGGFTESDIAVVWTSLSAQLPAQATPTHAKARTDSGMHESVQWHARTLRSPEVQRQL